VSSSGEETALIHSREPKLARFKHTQRGKRDIRRLVRAVSSKGLSNLDEAKGVALILGYYAFSIMIQPVGLFFL
jgi:hypothetical protein